MWEEAIGLGIPEALAQTMRDVASSAVATGVDKVSHIAITLSRRDRRSCEKIGGESRLKADKFCGTEGGNEEHHTGSRVEGVFLSMQRNEGRRGGLAEREEGKGKGKGYRVRGIG